MLKPWVLVAALFLIAALAAGACEPLPNAKAPPCETPSCRRALA